MPGRRYKHQITEGPYTGQDCRLIGVDTTVQHQQPHAMIELRSGTRTAYPMAWLRPKPPEVHLRRLPLPAAPEGRRADG